MDFSKLHIVKAGEHIEALEVIPGGEDSAKWARASRKKIEPWLSALFQSEHLSLLLGSGSTIAASHASGAVAQGMDLARFGLALDQKVNQEAVRRAGLAGRGDANFEDQISVALALEEGLRIAGQSAEADEWKAAINKALARFLEGVLSSERAMLEASGEWGIELLASLLLSCASRTSSRERLHVFTTNYDRFIERAADKVGLRLLDRFIGMLEPVFRASRLQIDMHYSPPGIRGEPRLLEGVCHFSKMHGSVDWAAKGSKITRTPIAFGSAIDHPGVPNSPMGTVMIYPNAAKDRETSGFPFAELFRDMAAAICRPNSTLVTYGYGFGDEHINRIIADMLTLPSSHLCIISYGQQGDNPHGRIEGFYKYLGKPEQVSLMLGPHFADLEVLVTNYLPRPALDTISFRKSRLEQNRGRTASDDIDDLNDAGSQGPAGSAFQ